MTWTKRQFIEEAFIEIGYGIDYDLNPFQLEAAKRRLDSLLATWNGKGIRLGYPLPSNPSESDIDMECPVPDWSNEAIYLNLALRIGAMIGKTVANETKQAAQMAYTQMLQRLTMPSEMQFPNTLPIGNGNKPWRYGYDNPFVRGPTDPILSGQDGSIELE